MGIKNINEELCNGCGVCTNSCPMDVIRMDQVSEKARIVFGDDCTTCFLCEMDCPTGAIYVSPEATKPVIPMPY